MSPWPDRRRDDVADHAAVGVEQRAEARLLRLEREELAVVAFPLVEVPLVTAVGRVHADDDVGVLHGGPERVELGQRERAATTVEVGDRCRPDEDGLGAPRHDPLELLDRLLDDGQRDHRGGEDSTVEVEGPLLVHPLVERVDDHMGGDGVVGEPLLEQAGERRPHHGPVDAELVHEHDAGLGVEEPRQRLDVLRRRRELDVFGPGGRRRVLEPELELLGAGRGDLVERGVRDVLADLVLDRDLRPPVDLDVLDHARVLRREVPGEGVLRLVHVVVGVEHRVRELAGHREPPFEGSSVSHESYPA